MLLLILTSTLLVVYAEEEGKPGKDEPFQKPPKSIYMIFAVLNYYRINFPHEL